MGQWGHQLGMRIKRLPDWVATQQAADLAGVVETVKLCAYRGHSCVRLYGDNLSTLLSAINGRAATVCGAQNKLLRQLQHTLRCAALA